MKIGPFEIWWGRETLNSQHSTLNSQLLSDAQLNRAFAGVEEKNLLLLAVRQVLETAERDANQLAADELAKNNPLIVAGYTGAAQQCRELADELQRRREQGLKELRSAIPGK